MLDKLEAINQRFIEVEKLISSPDAMNDMKSYVQLSKEYKDLTPIIEIYKSYSTLLSNIDEAKQIISEGDDPEMKEMAKMELDEHLPKVGLMEEEIKVLLIPKDPEDAKNAGADVVGAEELAEDMQKGNLNYDRVIATPDLMGVVGRIGKILGPKGLMPNPKLGTVTADVKLAVEAAKSGQVQYRAEKNGLVQAGVGKVSFGSEKITENINSFIDAVQKARPSGAKGTFIKKISISSTMGAGININM